MNTLREAIEIRKKEREELRKQQEEGKKCARKQREDTEQLAADILMAYLVEKYDTLLGTLHFQCRHVHGEYYDAIIEVPPEGYVKSYLLINTTDATVVEPNRWRAVHNSFWVDYPNFLDAIIYAMEG